MTIDQLDDDRLEQRLRTACHAVIPHLTDTDIFAGVDSDQRLDDEPTLATVTTLTPARTTGRARLLGVAAVTLLVAGGAATWAATDRPTDSNVGSASPSQPVPSAVVASPTTTALIPVTPDTRTPEQRAKDARDLARDNAWNEAVSDEMTSLLGGPCALSEEHLHTLCVHFDGVHASEGYINVVLSELAANVDTSSPGWEQQAAGFDTPGTPVGSDTKIFIEAKDQVVVRLAVVSPRYVITIVVVGVADRYVPATDDLVAVAEHLNGLADSVLATP